MNIKDAAEASGLSAKTIRYYEDVGLVVPGRAANGYRDFSRTDTAKLAFVARARELGFPLEECRALLALWEDRERSSAEVRRIASARLDEIERRIAGLREIRATLAHLVTACAGNDRPDCPILDSLSGETLSETSDV